MENIPIILFRTKQEHLLQNIIFYSQSKWNWHPKTAH